MDRPTVDTVTILYQADEISRVHSLPRIGAQKLIQVSFPEENPDSCQRNPDPDILLELQRPEGGAMVVALEA